MKESTPETNSGWASGWVIDFRPSPPNECASGVGMNVRGGGSWSTPGPSKPQSGADDQLHCVGESRITSHNIATFRRPTDSMKDSKQGELIEEKSGWVESQILPPPRSAVSGQSGEDGSWRISDAGLPSSAISRLATCPQNSNQPMSAQWRMADGGLAFDWKNACPHRNRMHHPVK